MNQVEIQDMIGYWLKNMNQRVAYLYGYYAEDPVYPKGVRAVVEFLYEPTQENHFNDSLILRDPNEKYVERIAEALGMQRIGWIYTNFMSDVFMSS